MSGPSSTFSVPQPPPPEVFLIQPPKRPYWLHLLLFLLTVLTTLIVGARLQRNFQFGQAILGADDSFFPLHWIWADPSRLKLGIPFSATLLSILMAHEMGHFFWSLRHRVYATLPFFLPAPSPIGTLGAFIKIKSPFRSRAALFDIGIAGPIAGFVVAVPLAFLGLALSRQFTIASDAQFQVGNPLIFHFAHWLMGLMHLGIARDVPLRMISFHPVATAAWVGMMATAFNLLPGGQLDGGHITYAVSPESHYWVSRAAMAALVPLAIFCWVGWLVWVIGIGFTAIHPQVPAFPELSPGRRALAAVAALILILTFAPVPFQQDSLWDAFRQFSSK